MMTPSKEAIRGVLTKTRSVALSATISALLLTACGGGGGGSGPITSAPPPSTSPTVATTPADFEESVRSSVVGLASSADEVMFGSVVVSTRNVTGISSTFDGRRAVTTVSRSGASDIRLDTANSYSDFGIEPSYVNLSGRTGHTRYVFNYTDTSATLGLVAVDWANTDSSDYLAGGYWLHAEGNSLTVEAGAFIDGPELSLNDPPNLPVSGSASYRGTAAGMYAAAYAGDLGVPAGSAELGEFVGVAILSADFSSGTIEGCIGCVGDIRLSGIYYDNATGQTANFDVSRDYSLELGKTAFDRDNGTFQGSDLTLTSPTVPIAQSSGAWAGQFSNRLSAGNPRLVGGTFSGQGSTPGGTQAVFLGAFAAGNQ